MDLKFGDLVFGSTWKNIQAVKNMEHLKESEILQQPVLKLDFKR